MCMSLDNLYPPSPSRQMNFKRMRQKVRADGTPSRTWEQGFLSTSCGETGKENIGYFQVRCCGELFCSALYHNALHCIVYHSTALYLSASLAISHAVLCSIAFCGITPFRLYGIILYGIGLQTRHSWEQ